MIQAATANLTSLQEEAYDYIVKQRKVEYLKERLQSELNFNSIRAVTRSVNKLLELSLIKEIEEAGTVYLIHNEPVKAEDVSTSVEETTSLEAEIIVDQRPISNVSTLEEVLPNEVLDAMKHLSKTAPEPIVTTETLTESKTILPELTEKHFQLLHLVQQEEAGQGRQLLNNNAAIAQQLAISKPTLIELKRELIHQGYITLSQQGSNSYIQLTTKGLNWLNQTSFKATEVSTNQESPVTRMSISSDPKAFMLRSTYKTLTPNEKFVYDILAKYMLKNPTAYYCSYKRLNAMTDIPSAQLKIITYSLQQKRLIYIKGDTNSNVYLSHDRATISKVFPIWVTKESSTYPPKKSHLSESTMSEPNTTSPSAVLTMPMAKTPETEIEIILPSVEEFVAEQCIYLVDTENTGFVKLIKSDQLSKLTQNDSIVLLLSQNTHSISPERFHLLMSSGARIETELVQVLGTGRSDLDHALIAELTLRLVQKPEAKYVILSNDKGYLGAIGHLEKKLKLAPGQLTLRSQF